jgi:putative tryptophan/tyrosine transport system substrate-binding protein
VEGRNLVIDRFSGEGQVDPFTELAREVVRHNPDLIFTPSSRLTLKFKESTTTIPIVGILGDPVGSGIVPSLARPGGNITGVSIDAGVEIFGKQLDLLKELNPAISKVGILASRLPFERSVLGTALREAANTARVLLSWPIVGPLNQAEYPRAFSVMARESANGLIVIGQNENWTYRRLIVELAEKSRLSAIDPFHVYDLRNEYCRSRPACGWSDRPYPQGRASRGDPYLSTDEVRAGHQPQDCKVARSHGAPALLAAADEVIE